MFFESIEKYQNAEGPALTHEITDKHKLAHYRLIPHILADEFEEYSFNIYREAEGSQLIGSTHQESETVFWGCHWPTGKIKRFNEASYRWVRAEVVEWIVKCDEAYLTEVWGQVFQ